MQPLDILSSWSFDQIDLLTVLMFKGDKQVNNLIIVLLKSTILNCYSASHSYCSSTDNLAPMQPFFLASHILTSTTVYTCMCWVKWSCLCGLQVSSLSVAILLFGNVYNISESAYKSYVVSEANTHNHVKMYVLEQVL